MKSICKFAARGRNCKMWEENGMCREDMRGNSEGKRENTRDSGVDLRNGWAKKNMG